MYRDDKGVYFPFVFSGNIIHKTLHLATQMVELENGGLNDWDLISAGFLMEDFACFGRSESLNLPSGVNIDTDIFNNILKDNNFKYIIAENKNHVSSVFIFSQEISFKEMMSCISQIRSDDINWTKPFFDSSIKYCGYLDKTLQCFGSDSDATADILLMSPENLAISKKIITVFFNEF